METHILADSAMIAESGQLPSERRPRRPTLRGPCPARVDTDAETVMLAQILQSHAPQGVEVSVRHCGDRWLSVLLTGLDDRGDGTAAAIDAFIGRWADAVRSFYDCPGGDCQPVDGSDRRPDVNWETRWRRYQVMHRRGMPYW